MRTASTGTLPIGGGRDFPGSAALRQALRQRFGVSEDRSARVAETYGTRAQNVLVFCAGRGDDLPLTSDCTLTAAEIAWMTAHDRALHLSDVVLRRVFRRDLKRPGIGGGRARGDIDHRRGGNPGLRLCQLAERRPAVPRALVRGRRRWKVARRRWSPRLRAGVG
ncbi:glycerol-3-phosphate dehydrogenase C-terminal domain-containing protein [Alloyangia pacifica]|uniref:glycerol-3-phosphate dehydrogenase C-terminal domain-containing protein n=1 Tax=Alloyangia pacifica TaxID=311180 RepID=UPI0031DB06F4